MPQLSGNPNEKLTGPLVVNLIYDGLCTFEFALAAEIFGLARPELGPQWYRYASAAVEAGPLRAHGGLQISAEAGIELLAMADLIVIAGWKGADQPVPIALIDALQQAWARGARLASICSGVFVLAATGLLACKKATTHWRYAEQLQRQYPDISVDADVLYVEQQRIYTSAGSAAGIDLLLHIVRQDFGAAVANSVARRLVMPPHRSGGQAQFIERPVPVDLHHRIAKVMDLVRKELTTDWTVDLMADAAAMSRRTFLRRFSEAISQSPSQWLIDTRIAEAKQLLETTLLPLEQISALVGFGSVQTLRHHFLRKLGVTPTSYRRTFSYHQLPTDEGE